jgi:hypothetical protein
MRRSQLPRIKTNVDPFRGTLSVDTSRRRTLGAKPDTRAFELVFMNCAEAGRTTLNLVPQLRGVQAYGLKI